MLEHPTIIIGNLQSVSNTTGFKLFYTITVTAGLWSLVTVHLYSVILFLSDPASYELSCSPGM